MLENLTIRRATTHDIEFIIEAILESEKSGTNVISSCNIFGLTEDHFKDILREVLTQNIEEYDYYLSGFIVAEQKGEYIGALGSFYEVADSPSGRIKATILFQYLDKSKMKDISKNSRIIKGITPGREPGCLQLEHGYVREKYRRQGVFLELIKENIIGNLERYSFPKVQGILFKDNFKSYNAHLKFGYEIVDERTVEDSDILKFYPYNTKVLLEFNEEKLSILSENNLRNKGNIMPTNTGNNISAIGKKNTKNVINDNLTYQQATTYDIDFIVEALIESEKSGAQTISTCNIFELDLDRYKEILYDLLSQDVENYDYYLSGFLIAKRNNEYVGASGSWLEGKEGNPSGVIKGNVLFPYLDRSKLLVVRNNLQIINGSNLQREIGALQLEHVYIRDAYRGKGIFSQLVGRNIKRNLDKYSFTKVQSILFKENLRSYSAFLRFGYNVSAERKSMTTEVLKFFPYNTKILMELYNEQFSKL